MKNMMKDVPFNQFATLPPQLATGGIISPKISSQLSQNINTPLSP